MKKLTATILIVGALASSTLFVACGTTGGGAVTSVQSWLTNPNNQQLITSIATTVISLLGNQKARKGAASPSIISQLVVKFPDVPAGALAAIARDPNAYLKTR